MLLKNCPTSNSSQIKYLDRFSIIFLLNSASYNYIHILISKAWEGRNTTYFYLLKDTSYLHCPGDLYGTASSSAFLIAKLHEPIFLLNRLDLYLDL